jgi:hypothetical protein
MEIAIASYSLVKNEYYVWPVEATPEKGLIRDIKTRTNETHSIFCLKHIAQMQVDDLGPNEPLPVNSILLKRNTIYIMMMLVC